MGVVLTMACVTDALAGKKDKVKNNNSQAQNNSVSVPEPASVLASLAALGGGLALYRIRRKKTG
jgi:hypothetical protein